MRQRFIQIPELVAHRSSVNRLVGVSIALAMIAAMAAFLFAPNARAQFGIAPGSYVAKTHPPVTGFTMPGGATPNVLSAARGQEWADLIRNSVEIDKAGSHPDASVIFDLNERLDGSGFMLPHGNARDVTVELPPGFVGNPLAAPRCSQADFLAAIEANPSGLCNAATQIGIATVTIFFANQKTVRIVPVYNLMPPAGRPAAFGMKVQGVPVSLYASVRSESDYGVNVTATDLAVVNPVFGSAVTIWGNPSDTVHNPQRFNPVTNTWGTSFSGTERRPFLSNPSYCGSGPLTTVIRARSWQDPDTFVTDVFTASSEPGNCDSLTFSGSLSMQPEAKTAETPSSFEVNLELPYNNDPEGLARPTLRKAEVTLPEGVTISPAAARGLSACTPAQVGLDRPGPARCPEASKLGTVEVTTPLLDQPLQGAVYQASQYDNPFGSLLAIYLVVEGSGVVVKLPGRVDTDPVTGQITSVFDDNPQLPFTHMKLRFFGGPGSALVTPSECGRYETVTVLTPWSAPHSGPPVVSRDSFEITSGPNGAPCWTNEAARQFSPFFEAGTEAPVAGTYSTFLTRFGRDDSDQELASIDLAMPEGLVAKIAGVDLCGSAQADAGVCGEGSRIGRVVIGAGAGQSPLWVPEAGKSPTAVYLSGPYRGAPYSLSIVVPAQAGPFDLGRVVVRAPINIDERTAQLSVAIAESRVYDSRGALKQTIAGAMPRILEGIPLRVKDVRVVIDRDEFTVNPTNCSEQQVKGVLRSTGNKRAAVSTRFQVADCASLGFAPRFRAKILNKGRRSTRRSWHPRTRFTVVPRRGDANIGGARVALPSSTILDQANIGTTCTRAQMAARNCPARSLVGYARAWSPLLNRPVKGPVYLAANGGVRPLPDLTAILDGEVRIVLVGEISTLRSRGKARLQNTFRVVPDAPVSRFVLTMRGGKRTGLLVNSEDLCRNRERGVAAFYGQNGKRHRLRPRVGLTFRGCRKVRRQAARRAKARKAQRRASGQSRSARANGSGPNRRH